MKREKNQDRRGSQQTNQSGTVSAVKTGLRSEDSGGDTMAMLRMRVRNTLACKLTQIL